MELRGNIIFKWTVSRDFSSCSWTQNVQF